LQLGLTEADHLGSVVFEKIVDDLLFGLLVQTSDIEGDQLELLPVRFHFREISFDSGSVSIEECISSMFSVGCSTPTVALVFVSGLLTPRCYLLFRTFGGRVPQSPRVFAVSPTSAVPVAWHLATQGLFFSVANAVAQQSHDVSWLFCWLLYWSLSLVSHLTRPM
jgi:hypothetical protein